MHRKPDSKKTKSPTSPTVWRCFSLRPRLDLWVMMFCVRNHINRSEFFRQCILDALRKHDPDGEPAGTELEVIQQRWLLRGVKGDSRMTKLEDSLPYKLAKYGSRVVKDED